MPPKEDFALYTIFALFFLLSVFVAIMSRSSSGRINTGGLEVISVEGGVTCYRYRNLFNLTRLSISCVKN